jgi:PKD domain
LATILTKHAKDMIKPFFLLIASLPILSCHKEPDELIPKACFELSPKSEIKTNDTIYFSNCSNNYKSVIWDFGDGDTSTEVSPKHVYFEPGTYKVLQKIRNIDLIDTISEFINVQLNYFIIGMDSGKTLSYNIDKLLDPFQGELEYSLDLDFDKFIDLNFSVINQRLMAGLCLAESNIKVETTHNNIELVVDSIYIKVLSFGDTLQMGLNWGKNTLLILNSYEDCTDFSRTFEGYWKDIDLKYIGFELNGKRGWIKAGLKHDNSALNLYEFAIEK